MSNNARHIPTLREHTNLHPREYAGSACFEAGYLVTKNAGWRNMRPVLQPKACTGCLQCYLLCPDGAIDRVAGNSEDSKARETVDVNLDFCKGCGICVKACKFDALTMVAEQEESHGE